jgi:hypothetical protein
MATASFLITMAYHPPLASFPAPWMIIIPTGIIAAPYLLMGLMALISHWRGDKALSWVASAFTVAVACPGALILLAYATDSRPGAGLFTLLMLFIQGILILTAIIVGLAVGFSGVGVHKGGRAEARPDEDGAS